MCLVVMVGGGGKDGGGVCLSFFVWVVGCS